MGTATHFIGVDSSTATRIASFTPYLILLTVPAMVLLLLARQRLAAAVCVAIAAAGIWSQLPLFVGSSHTTAPDDLSVRLMQANIRLGEADARSIVDTVVDERVDLLTVVELTPAAVGRLDEAGLSRTLQYSFVRPRDGGGGAGIFSRFPLQDGALLDGYALHNVKAVAQIPGAAPTEVYALHPVPPYPEPSWKWVYELRRLHAEFAAQTRPLIVGADFNSTYDHRQFRDLLRDSAADGVGALLDAQEYLGAGILATYPADRRFPALLAIDKILTRGPTPIAIRRVDLPGSDHHGLIGDIRVQRAGEPKER
ncbi:endonuclease/exonuclease/phosphatase family protein [[Mycobacterium] fortunisiensis]|uniref:endonuclease/exonuclease/phosphatase family protein n=1 Tax=[Mycobacterium] fortunisiensis TaxID=2600579 RepID=UPI0027E216EB|nr:endonuclease/exonuclease/phosphatase family protein [[Mycobacterium] fortunisiensis]